MNKDIKNVSKPRALRLILREMTPNSSVNIWTSAYKTQSVRVQCSTLNREYNRKIFVVTDKGLDDYCIVTRLS